MTNEGCGNCKFYQVFDDGSCIDEGASYCRRYPPSKINASEIISEHPADNVDFPVVLDGDWCGEWKPCNGL